MIFRPALVALISYHALNCNAIDRSEVSGQKSVVQVEFKYFTFLTHLKLAILISLLKTSAPLAARGAQRRPL
ncbi:MAG: hypothetical protein QNJ38_20050 [Prochloraceae cyanobacterium]|nr:hypothetical protein [Prochloraceae cyanobacterium]